jgi:hypothetical protein
VKGIGQILICAVLGTGSVLGLCARMACHLVGLDTRLTDTRAPDSPPDVPFTDLETAIAREGFSPEWVVHRRPDIPGPYRVVGLTFTIGNDPSNQAVVWHTDATGRSVAPIELRGNTEFNQMAVHLETADGQITGVVLKR